MTMRASMWIWAVIAAALALLPFWPGAIDSYAFSFLFFVFIYAILSQAWNLIAGFGGQISLGNHAFFGLGAYATAILWSGNYLWGSLYESHPRIYYFDPATMAIAGLVAAGHDLKLIARRLMQAFLRQALRDGFFHADMHQGNFFVDATGTIVAIDFGIMGRLGRKEQRFLAEILYGFIRRDYRRVAEVHFEAGYVPSVHSVDDFAQAIRAIGEPIHGQPARDISMARLLTLLFEVTEIFDMETRTELLLLQKTMVVVEGVSRSLDSDFDMWSASEPVIAEWVERNLGPVGQMERLGEGASALGRLANDLPALATRAERLSAEFADMGTRGLRLDPETVSAIGRAEAREGRWGRIALWVIAVVAVIFLLRAAF